MEEGSDAQMDRLGVYARAIEAYANQRGRQMTFSREEDARMDAIEPEEVNEP